ncbi:LOW QUALITY PROTEIN: hypothetical protein MAR_030826 [Mya arenaria]|uniref:DNA-directed DNA polymerase n=1 Tax=Mya arenaria TaxID=6604 RepID=A0ABY7F3N5_MYAAR|nr:LOW QUALITY PROTEIN: hypothetical protein MAR_030826 [Mya arenaria]
MPKKGSTLNFKHFFKSMRVPFIVHADFESFTQKLDTAQPYPYDSYTKQYQKPTPSGFCYNIKCFDDEVYKRINLKQNPVIYTKQTEDEDLRFIDSFKFMASSLDKLVGYLQKDRFVNFECGASGTLCQSLERPSQSETYVEFAQSARRFALLTRKGVYPYDYVDGLEKLAETQLPPKNEFYSKLSGDDISDEDYVHAQQVWKEFKCKIMRDYHNLYLTSDVMLLADVFETFRDVCLTNYNLDPAWYYTAPGLAWDAALKLTKVMLELISDPDMLLMIEKGITGGVSTIMTRYGKANNKNMGDEFDPKKDSTYLQYLDANNLFDKPVYLWMCIFDLSKTLMYEFHYYYIKPNYILDAYGTSGCKLLFTDTDSSAYEFQTEDFYADINENVEQMFDTSNFPADHPSGIKSGVNQKGCRNDECGGKIMHEFVGLRAKLCSYCMYEGKEEKNGAKSVVKREISFDDYKTCLLSRKEQLRKMNIIRSHGHEIFIEEVNKIALSANDDERVIQEDGVHTLAYGHWLLGFKGALRPPIGLARLPDR